MYNSYITLTGHIYYKQIRTGTRGRAMLKWTAENQVMRCLPNLEKDVIDDVNMEELYSLNS